MFTIEVEKKDKNGIFTVKDLKMKHGECYGGKIEFDGCDDVSSIFCESFIRLIFLSSCTRCQQTGHILNNGKTKKEVLFKIIMTAMDGKERQLSDDVRVVQATQ